MLSIVTLLLSILTRKMCLRLSECSSLVRPLDARSSDAVGVMAILRRLLKASMHSDICWYDLHNIPHFDNNNEDNIRAANLASTGGGTRKPASWVSLPSPFGGLS